LEFFCIVEIEGINLTKIPYASGLDFIPLPGRIFSVVLFSSEPYKKKLKYGKI